MEQNKVRTYLLYAIGEIALVMIGILLALQVNNWNEERQAHKFERTILSELQNAVRNDISYIEGHLIDRRTERIKEAHYYFYRKLRGDQVDPDSLQQQFTWLTFESQFQYNRGPYESIKSAGINTISEDSLRNLVSNAYDFEIPRAEELINWAYSRHTKVMDENIPLLRSKPELIITEDRGLSIENPVSDINFTTNPNFLTIFEQSVFTARWTEEEYKKVVAELKKIDLMITQALGK